MKIKRLTQCTFLNIFKYRMLNLGLTNNFDLEIRSEMCVGFKSNIFYMAAQNNRMCSTDCGGVTHTFDQSIDFQFQERKYNIATIIFSTPTLFNPVLSL